MNGHGTYLARLLHRDRGEPLCRECLLDEEYPPVTPDPHPQAGRITEVIALLDRLLTDRDAASYRATYRSERAS